MTRLQIQSMGWRIYALLLTIFAAPLVLQGLAPGPRATFLTSGAGLIALFGLIDYAYGFRPGPLLFWRGFVFLFSLGLMARAGRSVAMMVAGIPAGRSGVTSPTAMAIALIVMLSLCLALFRYAELIGGEKVRKEDYSGIFA